MTEPTIAPEAPQCPLCGTELAAGHPNTCSNCRGARHAKGYWISPEYPGAKMADDGTPWSSGGGRTVAIVAIVVVVLLIGGAAAAYVLTRPAKHTVQGSMTVFDDSFKKSRPGASCEASGGYSDVGGQVVLKNGSDQTMGIGSFSSGRIIDAMKQLDSKTTIDGVTVVGCQYTVTISDVEDAPVYRVAIGHRTPYEISKADMEKNGWKFELTLGDVTDGMTVK